MRQDTIASWNRPRAAASHSILMFFVFVFVQRMRGGDDYRLRGSPDSDDSDDDPDAPASSAAIQQRRQAARSTLAENWRLFLMRIPRMNQRTSHALC